MYKGCQLYIVGLVTKSTIYSVCYAETHLGEDTKERSQLAILYEEVSLGSVDSLFQTPVLCTPYQRQLLNRLSECIPCSLLQGLQTLTCLCLFRQRWKIQATRYAGGS